MMAGGALEIGVKPIGPAPKVVMVCENVGGCYRSLGRIILAVDSPPTLELWGYTAGDLMAVLARAIDAVEVAEYKEHAAEVSGE